MQIRYITEFFIHLLDKFTQTSELRILFLFYQLFTADPHKFYLFVEAPMVQLFFIELIQALLIQIKIVFLIKHLVVAEEVFVMKLLRMHKVAPV